MAQTLGFDRRARVSEVNWTLYNVWQFSGRQRRRYSREIKKRSELFELAVIEILAFKKITA